MRFQAKKKEKPPHFNNELLSVRRPSTLYLYWMHLPEFIRNNDPPFFSLCHWLLFYALSSEKKKEKPPHFNNELLSLRRPSTLYLYWMHLPEFIRNNDPPFFSLCHWLLFYALSSEKKRKTASFQ
jgi:hypothetical protein